MNIASRVLIFIVTLIYIGAVNAGDLEESSKRFIKLLSDKKYSSIIDEFYVSSPSELHKNFPGWVKGLTDKQVEEMFYDSRQAFKFDIASRYKETKLDLRDWSYTKTYYNPNPGSSEYGEGVIVITLSKESDDLIDRLDIDLWGKVVNGNFVLFSDRTISFDRMWEEN